MSIWAVWCCILLLPGPAFVHASGSAEAVPAAWVDSSAWPLVKVGLPDDFPAEGGLVLTENGRRLPYLERTTSEGKRYVCYLSHTPHGRGRTRRTGAQVRVMRGGRTLEAAFVPQPPPRRLVVSTTPPTQTVTLWASPQRSGMRFGVSASIETTGVAWFSVLLPPALAPLREDTFDAGEDGSRTTIRLEPLPPLPPPPSGTRWIWVRIKGRFNDEELYGGTPEHLPRMLPPGLYEYILYGEDEQGRERVSTLEFRLQ